MRNLTAIVLMVVAASVASAATALAVAPKEKKELILEPLSVTKASAAADEEDRCLAKAYQELRQNSFSVDEAKLAAVDMCVRDNFGRLGYAKAMAASFDDPAPTAESTNELIKQVKEFSSAAMARISENLESNR